MLKTENKVIFILGGTLVNDAGVWRTTNYNEGDNFGLSGDRLRVLAGGWLYQKNKNSLLVVLGGRGQLKRISGSPAVAKVVRRELIDFGVPAKKIIVETKSGNTYEQLIALKKFIKKNKIKKAVIISNRHHLDRIKVMLMMAPWVRGIKRLARIRLMSAEAVVLKYGGKKWQNIINQAKISQAMQERIKLERMGIKQIKKGIYNYGDKNCQ